MRWMVEFEKGIAEGRDSERFEPPPGEFPYD